MGDVEQLRDINTEPVERVVRILETALERAKSGELREVVVYGTLTGARFYRDCGFNDGVNLVGILEILKQDIITEMSLSAPTEGEVIE